MMMNGATHSGKSTYMVFLRNFLGDFHCIGDREDITEDRPPKTIENYMSARLVEFPDIKATNVLGSKIRVLTEGVVKAKGVSFKPKYPGLVCHFNDHLKVKDEGGQQSAEANNARCELIHFERQGTAKTDLRGRLESDAKTISAHFVLSMIVFARTVDLNVKCAEGLDILRTIMPKDWRLMSEMSCTDVNWTKRAVEGTYEYAPDDRTASVDMAELKGHVVRLMNEHSYKVPGASMLGQQILQDFRSMGWYGVTNKGSSRKYYGLRRKGAAQQRPKVSLTGKTTTISPEKGAEDMPPPRRDYTEDLFDARTVSASDSVCRPSDKGFTQAPPTQSPTGSRTAAEGTSPVQRLNLQIGSHGELLYRPSQPTTSAPAAAASSALALLDGFISQEELQEIIARRTRAAGNISQGTRSAPLPEQPTAEQSTAEQAAGTKSSMPRKRLAIASQARLPLCESETIRDDDDLGKDQKKHKSGKSDDEGDEECPKCTVMADGTLIVCADCIASGEKSPFSSVH